MKNFISIDGMIEKVFGVESKQSFCDEEEKHTPGEEGGLCCFEKYLHVKASESKFPLAFLYQSFRAIMEKDRLGFVSPLGKLIVEIAAQVVCQGESLSDVYIRQIKKRDKKLRFEIHVFKNFYEMICERLIEITASFEHYRVILIHDLENIFGHMCYHLATATLMDRQFEKYLGFINCFCHSDTNALIFLECNIPKLGTSRGCQDTILGQMLSFSTLPSYRRQSYRNIFIYLGEEDLCRNKNINKRIARKIAAMNERFYKFFESLFLRTGEVILACLGVFKLYVKAHGVRNRENVASDSEERALSDGFMSILQTILVKLFHKISLSTHQQINPHLFRTIGKDVSGFHFATLSTQTPQQDQDTEKAYEASDTLTILFFLAHRCIDLTMKNNIEQLVEIIMSASTVHCRKSTAVKLMAVLINKKAVKSLWKMLFFTVWLLNRQLNIPSLLSKTPEFVLSNVIDWFNFYLSKDSDSLSLDNYECLLNVTVELMANQEKLSNHHHRQELAEISMNLMMRGKYFGEVLTDYKVSDILTQIWKSFIDLTITSNTPFSELRPYLEKTTSFICDVSFFEKFMKEVGRRDQESIHDAEGIPMIVRFQDALMRNFQHLLELIVSHQNSADFMKILHSHERYPSSYHFLINTVHYIGVVTSRFTASFCNTVIVERMTRCLVLFLKHIEFRKTLIPDDDLQGYNLQENILHIFGNLSQSEYKNNLFTAISDGELCTLEFFEKILNANDLNHYVDYRIINFLHDIKVTFREKESLVDIPSEFLDGITCQMMSDPFILSNSDVRVDRGTIHRLLIDGASNPFTRQTLTMDSVKSDEDLCLRIDEWLRAKNICIYHRK